MGSVFRMIILAAFADQDESMDSLWQRFCNGADLKGKIILDPFMGGGTTVVEANRLGCKVIGVDVNPTAWFLTKKEIEPIDLEDLRAALNSLEEKAGRFIKRYYQTKCPGGHQADVMYFFWVKVVECGECGVKVRLFPSYELSRNGDDIVSVCPSCLQVVTSGYKTKARCPECGEIFDPHEGISGRGIFQCHACGTKQRILDAVKRKGSKLDEELYALEGYCRICGRFFKRVDGYDIKIWEKAKKEFERRRTELLIPTEAIPIEGRSDPRPVNHGYYYFWQMFNERQLLCLSKLLEEILKLPDRNIREFMLVAFSDCLDTNTMFCKYEVQWHKISVLFGLHAYHPIERPTENNVWGTIFGRGTFTRCFEKVRRAKEYCQKPYERLVDSRGKRFSKYTGKERIEGYYVENYQDLLKRDRSALLRCTSSEDLSFIPDKSVDAVITDPPYFENIQYSELADFFYVWLRLALKDEYPWFIPEYSARPEEIVYNEKQGKSKDFFSQSLQRVFQECHRVLKDDGIMAFTFHHNKTWAWETIARVLLESGFYISASPIVRSEGKSGFHSSEGNIRYDAVLVCRKRPSGENRNGWDEIKRQILSDSVDWARRTLESGVTVNRVDIFTIVMAKSIEYITKAWENLGCFAGIADLLGEMEEIVDDIVTQARTEIKEESKSHDREVKQLVLLLKESEAPYLSE